MQKNFFLIINFNFLIECWQFYIFWIKTFITYVFCKYFLPICGLSFYFCNCVFWRAEVLCFMKSNLSFMDCVFSVIYIKSLHNPRLQRLSTCFLLEVSVFTCIVYGMNYKSSTIFWNTIRFLIAFAPLSKFQLLVYVICIYKNTYIHNSEFSILLLYVSNPFANTKILDYYIL